MSRFISSFLMIFTVAVMAAQEQAPAASDSVPAKLERYGIRVGADLHKLTRSFYDDDYKGLELVADYRLTKKYYLAGEIGTEDITVDDDRINFSTTGSYFKAGFDYNTYENWLDMENLIHIGLRYGVSSFSQTVNSYDIYNPNPHYGEAPTTIDGTKHSGLTASWAEIILGVKAEMFSNFYAGFSVSLKRLVTNKQPDNFDNLYIPGFGRTFDGPFGVGFNYTVSYFIPIYKKAAKPKEDVKK